MTTPSLDAVPEALRPALTAKGISTLTAVQTAVLAVDPTRDLRVSSQTGSGKTVAFGFAIERILPAREQRSGAPAALVITPTRELAAQVRQELSWLLEPLKVRVVAVTGGTSVRTEQKVLKSGADIVVGTPGRLADHIRTNSLDCSKLGMVVLDEADEMLDMGFRDEVEAILEATPKERRTHMVSATFPRAVMQLADKFQQNALDVQGTRLGVANADIEHLVHLVLYPERADVIINVLLVAPDESALVFCRTREGAGELARALRGAGFAAASLTGELEQKERTRTLDSFRSGEVRVLVATDVAARGIDLPDVTRVIHADPPEDPDTYTHRSGRTGRAGRKGQSILIVPMSAREKAQRTLARARIFAKVTPVPTEAEILAASEERLLGQLRNEGEAATPQVQQLAERLLAELEPITLVTRLLGRVARTLPSQPRRVTTMNLDRTPRPSQPPRPSGPPWIPGSGAPRFEGPREPRPEGAARGPAVPKNPADFSMFRVTWGERQGADTRRMLAVLCRRGNIQSSDVGAIRIGAHDSMVEVRSDVAEAFSSAAGRPDPRDPRVKVYPVEAATEDPRGTFPGNNRGRVPSAAPRAKPTWGDGARKPTAPRTRGPRLADVSKRPRFPTRGRTARFGDVGMT
jgi:ATP-dependent RNA helicase DeaD